MPISKTFLYLQENKYHFLRVAPLFIKGAKNHRNRFNRFCQKKGDSKTYITHART